jgi:hypothetical protein
LNPDVRAQFHAEGIDITDALVIDIATENAVYDSIDRSSVTLGCHLC